jgi:hypothetical protein
VDPATAQRGAGGESVRERLFAIVNASEHPLDVDAAMQLLPGIKRKTVSWTLWDLAKREEIQRVGKLYARLSYTPPRSASGLMSGIRQGVLAYTDATTDHVEGLASLRPASSGLKIVDSFPMRASSLSPK